MPYYIITLCLITLLHGTAVIHFEDFEYCRAKDFCAELKTEISFVEETEYMRWTNPAPAPDFPIQQFPGYRDTGAPLIIETRGRMTIIGMFREQLDEHGKGPSMFSKIHPDAFNWIVNYADWTEDDTCTKYTSCSCGIEANSEVDLFNNGYVGFVKNLYITCLSCV